ncbi:MAG: hypothetical protein JW724_01790, partial [Candidatus Altiarchaeota archaeon]|nr:hypothetical protein [Candidatus Altiarchaeota archaeon]
RPQGTGTLSFLWEFNGRTHTGQVFQLFDRDTGESFLPKDPAAYPVHLTVTDELGETYTEDILIEILPEDAKPSISIKLGADEGGDDDFDGDCRVWLDIDYFDKNLWHLCDVKFTDHLGYREISHLQSPIQFEFTTDGRYTVKVRCLTDDCYNWASPRFAFYDPLPFGGSILKYTNDPTRCAYSAEDTITVSGCRGKLPSLKPGPDEFADLCKNVPGCTFFDAYYGPSTWGCPKVNCASECGSRGMTACHSGPSAADTGFCLPGVSVHGMALWWPGCCCR